MWFDTLRIDDSRNYQGKTHSRTTVDKADDWARYEWKEHVVKLEPLRQITQATQAAADL